MDKTEGFAPPLFIIHFSLFIKKESPTVFYCRGRIFVKNPRYHPRLRDFTHGASLRLRLTVRRRQRLPRRNASARSALGSPFAVSLSRVSSIGGSLWQRGTGTILRHRFMMVYDSIFFLICQGVLGFFSGKLTVIPHCRDCLCHPTSAIYS